MGIILGKATHTRKSVELTALLVTIDRTELCKSQREVLIRTRRAAVNLTVVRTVHRLEHIFFTFLRSMNRLEGVFSIFSIVTRRHIKFLSSDVRSNYRKISEFLLFLTKELLEGVAHLRTARKPHRKSEAYARRKGEKFHLLTQFAVVTLLSLLYHKEILVEQALLRERYAVDTCKLLPALVTLPVSTGDGRQMYRLYVIHVLYVRTATQVSEVTVLVECDGAVFQRLYEFALVRVTLLFEVLKSLGLRNILFFKCFFSLSQFLHLTFYRLQVRFADLPSA